MSNRLSHSEVQEIINRLRGKYRINNEKYGEKYFSLKKFNERYMEALHSKVDIQTFAYAEVMALEDIKKKMEEDKEEARIRTEKPFTRKIEKYLNELQQKQKKYIQKFSASGLSEECQHLCGAFESFYNETWLSLDKFFQKDMINEKRAFNIINDNIQKYFMFTGNNLPYEVDKFVINMNKLNFEKANMLFLKEAALLFKDIKCFISTLIEEHDEIMKEHADYFKGLNKAIKQIIDDFRFGEIIGIR